MYKLDDRNVNNTIMIILYKSSSLFIVWMKHGPPLKLIVNEREEHESL